MKVVCDHAREDCDCKHKEPHNPLKFKFSLFYCNKHKEYCDKAESLVVCVETEQTGTN